VSGQRSNRAELSAQNCDMNWTMMADTNVKHQCYQHPQPPCQARFNPIQACPSPVSDSSSIEPSGCFVAELPDDGATIYRSDFLPGALLRARFEERSVTRSVSAVRLSPGVYIVDPPSGSSTERLSGARSHLLLPATIQFAGGDV
jgi:hypothetical protein